MIDTSQFQVLLETVMMVRLDDNVNAAGGKKRILALVALAKHCTWGPWEKSRVTAKTESQSQAVLQCPA